MNVQPRSGDGARGGLDVRLARVQGRRLRFQRGEDRMRSRCRLDQRHAARCSSATERESRVRRGIVQLDAVSDPAHLFARIGGERDRLAGTRHRRVVHDEPDPEPPDANPVRGGDAAARRQGLGRGDDVGHEGMEASLACVRDLAFVGLGAGADRGALGQVEDLDRPRGPADVDRRPGVQHDCRSVGQRFLVGRERHLEVFGSQ